MPIYEYLCNACGVEKEHLQKISDAPIAACPNCGSSSYVKRISAAGFQLKGSGWYVTDFKNNKAKPSNDTAQSAETKQSTSATSSESSPSKEASNATSSTASEE